MLYWKKEKWEGQEKGNKMKLLKKEPMLAVSLTAAVVALFITPPSAALLSAFDWRTLGTLFLMLTILEGFKKENIFNPLNSLLQIGRL